MTPDEFSASQTLSPTAGADTTDSTKKIDSGACHGLISCVPASPDAFDRPGHSLGQPVRRVANVRNLVSHLRTPMGIEWGLSQTISSAANSVTAAPPTCEIGGLSDA